MRVNSGNLSEEAEVAEIMADTMLAKEGELSFSQDSGSEQPQLPAAKPSMPPRKVAIPSAFQVPANTLVSPWESLLVE